MKEADEYVLGTHDQEIARLGLQHRAWLPAVLDCWQRAGITHGKSVLDVGAGPGYATIDLAEMVGSKGKVVAVERSARFLSVLRETCAQRGLGNVTLYERDVIEEELPNGPFDFAWCRWLASFVKEPGVLVRKIADALRPGGSAIFHEYAHYTTWKCTPRRPALERFAEKVAESWRNLAGEADVGLNLIPLLRKQGCELRWAKPLIFCVTPGDYLWEWPASFIETGPERMEKLGVIDHAFAQEVRAEFAAAAAQEETVMLTPLVLEIVVRKR